MKYRVFAGIAVVLNLLLLLTTVMFTGAQSPAGLTGIFSYTYIDDPVNPQVIYHLTTANDEVLEVELDPALTTQLTAYYRQPVYASLSAARTTRERPYVESLTLTTPRAFSDKVVGTVYVVNLLCQPSNFSGEPVSKALLTTRFSDTYPGLGHYWSLVSHGNSTLDVQTLNWRKMTRTTEYYVALSGQADRMRAIFEDCTAAHDPFFDFSAHDYVINIILGNNLFGTLSIGGGSHAYALDGVKQSWRTTWMAPGYQYHSILSHEMYHALGFPHSTNNDNDNWPYDNIWDTMSAGFPGYYTVGAPYDDIHFYLSQPSNSFHYDYLGWLAADQKFTLIEGDTTITVDSRGVMDSPNYYTAVIPLADGRMYYVEAHNITIPNVYEDYLPESGVLVYEVDLTRRERAWLVGGTSEVVNEDNWSASALQPGESFTSPADGVTITVLEAVGSGYSLTLSKTGDNTGMELLKNGSFEDNWMGNLSVTTLGPWKVKNSKNNAKCAGYYNPGDPGNNNSSCAMQFKGKAGKPAPKIKQNIKTELPDFAAGDSLIFSLYYTATLTSGKLNANARINFSDGTTQIIKLADIVPEASYTWHTSDPVAVEGLATRSVVNIIVNLKYVGTAGKVMVDDVSLVYIPAGVDAAGVPAGDVLPLPSSGEAAVLQNRR